MLNPSRALKIPPKSLQHDLLVISSNFRLKKDSAAIFGDGFKVSDPRWVPPVKLLAPHSPKIAAKSFSRHSQQLLKISSQNVPLPKQLLCALNRTKSAFSNFFSCCTKHTRFWSVQILNPRCERRKRRFHSRLCMRWEIFRCYCDNRHTAATIGLFAVCFICSFCIVSVVPLPPFPFPAPRIRVIP